VFREFEKGERHIVEGALKDPLESKKQIFFSLEGAFIGLSGTP
jgi:hypothetical protein